MKTSFNIASIPKYYIIDAKNNTLGKMATKVSLLIRNKNLKINIINNVKLNYIIIVNVSKIAFLDAKLLNTVYYKSTKRPGSLKKIIYKDLVKKNINLILKQAIKRMLPKNNIAKKFIKNIYFFNKGYVQYNKKELKQYNDNFFKFNNFVYI